jgi:3-dehydroquinate synthase
MRGVPLVQVPTSLLAQVDASIGGKVGANHAGTKNLVGAVYQPQLVVIDPALLATLPDGELANGMAEVIKTAIIGSAELFERLSLDTASPGERPSEPFLADVVVECARIKAGVVERDPYERDLRRVLNLGHTLGHALEAALDHAISHGEAVGLGLLAAWRIAVRRGRAEARWLEETRALLESVGLPVHFPDVERARIRAALDLDKKRRAGRLTFVLPIEPGRVIIVDDVTEDELLDAMDD